MKFINVLQGWEGYNEAFSAEVTLSSAEISLIRNLLQNEAKKEDNTEINALLSEFNEIENVLLKEKKIK